MTELTCSHAEADTAILTIQSVLQSECYTAAVILDTEDTDNYVQAVNVVQRTPGLLCVKCKHQLIIAQSLCNEEMFASIIPLHVLIACEHNSGFYGASKKLFADCPENNILAPCGTQLPVTQEVISDLEIFVIFQNVRQWPSWI